MKKLIVLVMLVISVITFSSDFDNMSDQQKVRIERELKKWLI